jgi:hypothetical protein
MARQLAAGAGRGMSEAVLDAPPQTAAGAQRPRCGYRRTCPECGTAFIAPQPGHIFCRTGHKRTYNNRWLTRGAVLAPIVGAARATRYGTRGDKETGKRASSDANRLIQRWQEEDAAAGRMSAVDYMALRYRLGLVETLR